MAAKQNASTNGDTVSGMQNGGIVNDIKSSASDAFGQAQDKVSEAAGRAQQTAKSQLADRKDQVADSIDNVASTLRRTSDDLSGEGTNMFGDYVGQAADKVSSFSQHLRQSDPDQLLSETEDFARREPTLFLAGAFALGVIAARFLKSSSERDRGYSLERASGSNYGYSPASYDRDQTKEW